MIKLPGASDDATLLASEIWKYISIAAFLSGDKNERWLYKVVMEFEQKVRADERSKFKEQQ